MNHKTGFCFECKRVKQGNDSRYYCAHFGQVSSYRHSCQLFEITDQAIRDRWVVRFGVAIFATLAFGAMCLWR